MKWLKRKIRNWMLDEDTIQGSIFGIEKSNYAKYGKNSVKASYDSSCDQTLSGEPMRLGVFRANGGTIIETRSYDKQKDHYTTQLHIIGHDQDLGEGIAKIITLESLRG